MAAAGTKQTQQVVRQSFLWCMAAIYLFAFTSLYVQIPVSSCTDKSASCSLWASSGECDRNIRWMTENCMKSCNSCHVLDTSFSSLFRNTPTLLWMTPYLGLDTPTGMEFLCVIGIALSIILLVSQRCRDCLGYLTLWFLYYSMLPVGQIFLRYQWDALLWESGFLAFLVAPWNIVLLPWKCGKYTLFRCRRFSRNTSRHHDSVNLWLVKWLLFRLMFASGVVKLTYMDTTWWDLSALNWHYESQCIPTPVAWYFQKLPAWFHRLSVVLTYVIEIGIPFLAFAPVRILRVFVYCSEVFLQLLILLTGNYNFFNLLTIVLCVSLLDDKCILSRIQCFLCKRCVRSSCLKAANQRTKTKTHPEYTEVKQEDSLDDVAEEKPHLKKSKVADVEEARSSVSKRASSMDATSQTKDKTGPEETSTASQLVEYVLDWMNTRHENSKFTRAREFLHSKMFGWIKMAAISISFLAVLIVIIVCTVKWFGIKVTKQEPVHCETAFTAEQLVNAVQIATQFAMWIGFLSLLVEILGVIIRCLLEQCGRRVKLWQLFQCVVFSAVALLMFAVSLYSFTAVDRVVQRSLPKTFVNLYRDTAYLELTNAYGLFRSMTGVGGRPELIILGSNSLDGPWKEYNFLYKPGNIYQPPPFVAPHQPRLDWQMWFAALESYSENPWFLSLLHKLLLGQPDVLHLMGKSHFGETPPRFIRAQLYLYHYTQNTSSLWQVLFHPSGEKTWWTREFTREYLPFVVSNSSLSTLEGMLQKQGIYRPNFKPEVTWGFLYPFIRDLRKAHRRVAPTTLINALLFTVVTCLVLKVWWRRTGRKFCSLSLTSVQDKRDKSKPPSRNAEQNEQEGLVESKNSKATCGKCVHCVSYMDKLRAMFKEARKEIAIWCGLVYCKLQENYQRFKALWKSRMPSVKKKA
ncbi:lipase maturation factor 2-like isoform X6 [Orbicella faveolata]|uniref:lipase maturation factor 2-like isoform X6 n=1 Tax=Orbicella faveolata TaxID=48498 RepID=UPI0009E39B40|nr:lipase maturation factor 2-like isoform X6 [Orbicella faveolata]